MRKSLIRQSERIYDFLLLMYPEHYRTEFGKEMKYVFSESLKDAYKEHGEVGILAFWSRALLDTGKSIYDQRLDTRRGGDTMTAKKTNLLMQNKIFLWIALATGLMLMIPLLLMQFTSEMNWDETDFIIVGILVFGMASFCVLAARKIKKKSHRIAVGIAFLLAFLYIYAELAVGIFTNLGS